MAGTSLCSEIAVGVALLVVLVLTRHLARVGQEATLAFLCWTLMLAFGVRVVAAQWKRSHDHMKMIIRYWLEVPRKVQPSSEPVMEESFEVSERMESDIG